jgi:hypothetical protein
MVATNTLTGEHVRNRPTYGPSLYRRAAEILIARVNEYDIDLDGADLEDAIRELESVTGTTGGYERARDLERAGWMPDRNMVEWLDDNTVWDAHREAVIEWVKTEGITASLPVGACVTVSHRMHNDGAPAQGVITRIDADEAKYTVRVPSWGHVPDGQIGTQGIILTFEDVETANPSPAKD